MIIRSSKLSEGNTLEEQGGKIVLTHTENIEPVLEANYASRKDLNNGWSKNRNMRRIASIPFTVWLQWTKQYPELIMGDKELKEKTLRKILKEEEMKQFWTVEKGV